MNPSRPSQLPDYAELCLTALSNRGLGHRISLGGALGLSHYLDYRTTHDVDAWWQQPLSEEEKTQVINVVVAALRNVGEVGVRSWGDVVSVELKRDTRKVFSFQIAERAVELEPAKPAPWVDVLLDSFTDLLASKMVAMVERGAPRDFRDVYHVCRSKLSTPAACWRLWRERQARAGASLDVHRARLAVETHLSRIAMHRPLTEISDPSERAAAEEARAWYREELLDALVD